MAKMAALLTVTLTGFVAGTEAAQPTDEEKHGLEKHYHAFLEANGIKDVPPGLALCIVVGVYAMPRLMLPQSRARLSHWGRKVTGKTDLTP